jgi:hypothetical protein
MTMHTLTPGRLSPAPDVTTGQRARKLIDTFIEEFTTDTDRIEWSAGNARARSNLVNDPADRSIRIDLQPPPPGLANLQLQAGPKSLACVLLECDRSYLASEVRDAFVDSLNTQQNARMVWRYVANRLEMQVLNSLDAWEPRAFAQIINQMTERGMLPWAGVLPNLPYLTDAIRRALTALEANALVQRRAGETWVLSPAGVVYTG